HGLQNRCRATLPIPTFPLPRSIRRMATRCQPSPPSPDYSPAPFTSSPAPTIWPPSRRCHFIRKTACGSPASNGPRPPPLCPPRSPPPPPSHPPRLRRRRPPRPSRLLPPPGHRPRSRPAQTPRRHLPHLLRPGHHPLHGRLLHRPGPSRPPLPLLRPQTL